jgi:hypothetical protein
MTYEDIKDFTQRCEEHPAHQTGMVSYQMIQDRLSEEIDELREYIEQRTWVGLTEEEMERTCYEVFSYDPYTVARAIEAKLRSKNTKP